MERLSGTSNRGRFNPWSWPVLTDEQFSRLMPNGTDTELEKSRFFQYLAVQHCKQVLKVEIEKTGSGFAVLAAVRKCGQFGLPMPDWLVSEFNRKYDAVLNFRAASWDDQLSFGKPYPKGTTIAAKRKERLLGPAVWNAVNSILKSEPTTPIEKGLFARVGGPLNIGATLAEEYYYSWKKKYGHLAKPDTRIHMVIDGCNIPRPRNTAKNQKIAEYKSANARFNAVFHPRKAA